MLKSLILLGLLCLSRTSNAEELSQNKYAKYLSYPSVERFREYVSIDTSKEENLKYAVDFLIKQATEIGIPYAVYSPAGKPIFVATVEGSDPSLPSIMLNSHMDVVKVDAKEWKYPPFDAHMESKGDIYGRGTQDTKDVCIQLIEAIRRLRKDNVTLARTLHLTVMPDEESGGYDGIKAFIKTDVFKSMNVGFALDEGLPSSDDSLITTYVDRRPWQMEFTIHGQGGHGYTMPDGTAMEQTYKFISMVMAFRDTQKKIVKSVDNFDYGEYTSVNINMIDGGLAPNVIPSSIKVVVDMRLSVKADADEMQSMVYSWMQEAGNETEVSYIRQEKQSAATAIDDTNPYWVTMNNTLNDLGIKLNPIVCPATSDMLVLRNLGIPAFGFTTKSNTIARLHGKDEYQNVETFLRGIDIYTELVKNLGNLNNENTKKTC
ncbi:aminoacylase-1 [Helicoverpa armigera]|uniref:aminoacylase-1 n=1 Tax=Helicoverpa armigera TaxID=29058 RepID=UPI0030836EE3